MAGRGPAPKDPSKRRRRNATDPETVIVNDGALRGPELPEGVLPGDEEWHPMTVNWWQTWRTSPMAATFLDTDWAFLLDAALMHHTAWTKGKWEFLSEVRMRSAKFGATPEDRARLKLRVDEPTGARQTPAQRPDNVSDINSRRARLTG
ncbi:hypothetical protein AB0K92_16220 [Streptomyces sp. NPDC052687]|uniref:phage terminase small subunit n=1 Tax=Streptomyces sp. NPDC052687 TaxID=3154759 RepID=UPI00341B694D